MRSWAALRLSDGSLQHRSRCCARKAKSVAESVAAPSGASAIGASAAGAAVEASAGLHVRPGACAEYEDRDKPCEQSNVVSTDFACVKPQAGTNVEAEEARQLLAVEAYFREQSKTKQALAKRVEAGLHGMGFVPFSAKGACCHWRVGPESKAAWRSNTQVHGISSCAAHCKGDGGCGHFSHSHAYRACMLCSTCVLPNASDAGPAAQYSYTSWRKVT